MRSRIHILWLLLAASCAGAPRMLTPPPISADAARLAFTGTFGSPADIAAPGGLSFGADGSLYVCDAVKRAVVRLDGSGAVTARFAGYLSGAGRVFSPVDVCTTGGTETYVVDMGESRVLRLDRGLRDARVVFRGTDGNGRRFGAFGGIALDRATGDLYITDRSAGELVRLDMLGGSVQATGSFGSDRRAFGVPGGVDVTSGGIILVADEERGAVACIERFGAAITLAGADVLEAPVDVAALPDGGMAVADRRGVVLLSPEGGVAAVAGFSADDPLVPVSVAVGGGRLYVSDRRSGTIRVYALPPPTPGTMRRP